MDDLDWQIIDDLQQDGRRPYRQIGRKLGVSPGTVRARVLQLVEDNVVQVIAVPNSSALGYRFQATVGLRLDPGHADQAADLLAARPEVGWIGLTTSGFDVMFEVTLEDGRSFGAFKETFLAGLPGCREIEVFEIWSVKKFHYELASLARDRPTPVASGSRGNAPGNGAVAAASKSAGNGRKRHEPK